MPCSCKIKQAKYGLKVSLLLLPLLSNPPDERGAWKLAIYLHTNAYILYTYQASKRIHDKGCPLKSFNSTESISEKDQLLKLKMIRYLYIYCFM